MMKNIDVISRIVKFSIVSFILGFLIQGVAAQSKKANTVKSKTKVEVRIIKEDDKGNVIKTDTTFEVNGDVSEKDIVRKIENDKVVKVTKEGNKEIRVVVTGDIDSQDSLAKEIQTTVMVDGENPDPDIFMNPQGPNHPFPFDMGMTPWGRITKFEVKDTKHGKKIRIETNDEGMMVMPPMPPGPPHCKKMKECRFEQGGGRKSKNKKVIIIEKDGKGDRDRNE
jgi:hypothetical protein